MPTRVDSSMVTSGLEIPGYRIVRNYGIVRGIIVRSRSVIGNLGAALQTIVGGNITILTNLCEKTREDAYELLLQHAGEHGEQQNHDDRGCVRPHAQGEHGQGGGRKAANEKAAARDSIDERQSRDRAREQ